MTEEQARIKQLEEQVAILTQQVEYLKRQLFGKKSEKLDHPELFGDEPGKEVSSSGADAPVEDDAGDAPRTEGKKRRRRIREERLPENLPVVEEEILPAAVQAEPPEVSPESLE